MPILSVTKEWRKKTSYNQRNVESALEDFSNSPSFSGAAKLCCETSSSWMNLHRMSLKVDRAEIAGHGRKLRETFKEASKALKKWDGAHELDEIQSEQYNSFIRNIARRERALKLLLKSGPAAFLKISPTEI